MWTFLFLLECGIFSITGLMAWLTSVPFLLLSQNLNDKQIACRPNLTIFRNNSKKALHLSSILHPKKTLLPQSISGGFPNSLFSPVPSDLKENVKCIAMINPQQCRHLQGLCNMGKDKCMQTNQNNPFLFKKIEMNLKDSHRKDSLYWTCYKTLFV